MQAQPFAPEVLKPDYSVPVLPQSMDVRALTQKSINFNNTRDVYFNAIQPTITQSADQTISIIMNADGNSFADFANTNLEFDFTLATNTATSIYHYGQFFQQVNVYVNEQLAESTRVKLADLITMQMKVAPIYHMSNGYYGTDSSSFGNLSPLNYNTTYHVSLPINFLTGLGANRMMPMFGPLRTIRFDIQLNSVAKTFKCASASQSCTLSNIRLISRFIGVEPEVRNSILSQWMQSGKIQFLNQNWGVNILNTGASATGSQNTFILNHPHSRPKALFFLTKDAGEENNFNGVKNRFVNAWQDYQYIINGQTVPNIKITTGPQDGSQLLYQLDRCFGKSNGLHTAYWNVNNSAIVNSTVADPGNVLSDNDASCILSYDCEVVHSLSSSSSNFSMMGNGANSQIVLTRNNDVSTKALECISVCVYEYLLEIDSMGQVRKIE